MTTDPYVLICAAGALFCAAAFIYWLQKRNNKKAFGSLFALMFCIWATTSTAKADTFKNTPEGWKAATEKLKEAMEKR